MIELLHPWLLLLLPLPWLVWWALPAAPEGKAAALRVPFRGRLEALSSGAGRAGRWASAIVAVKALAWALLVLAAARPVWLGEPEQLPTEGRDLMLALDLSGSMETPDFVVEGREADRLTVVREVAKHFVQQREGDRLGLVLFGSRAYLQAPITRDRPTLVAMLDEAELGLAGEETAIGDAIGIAVEHLRERPEGDRVLVLLSDGANNAGVLDPLEAAEIAAAAGVKIYTIGVGTGAQMVQGAFGTRLFHGQDGVDEATLQEVARRTGGLYLRARDTASLVEAHQLIDSLEVTEGETVSVRPLRELFHRPLAAAAALALALLVGSLLRAVRASRPSSEGAALELPELSFERSVS
jgi:Ca-activated chloride channel family protein